MFWDHEQEERDYELGAQLGDPRRCPRHPWVKTSSPDGMFDAPCNLCEYECDMAFEAARPDDPFGDLWAGVRLTGRQRDTRTP
jgi:hypothetical protein